MRLALGLCVLSLLFPAAALADLPVISYVDENGVFRLYEAEFNREVEPPPPVPTFAPASQLRYAISLNGRYIAFNDSGKKLHLLDRATNTQVPLPGIDVYANPGSLTVSNAGLIAFDDNGQGGARVYDSGTGQFVETGLPAGGGGHRQTRLSGDGHFLATTCDDTLSTCVAALDAGVDPYVQDLVTKEDTGFPNDALFDEEHPCIDGDGSLVGFDKPAGAVLPYDIFVFERGTDPPSQKSYPALNDPLKDENDCVLDATGAYIGLIFDQSGTPSFRVYQVASEEFLTLPADKEFDSRSVFSEAYSPPRPPGGGDPKPVVSRFRMTHRRFRVRPRATSFKFNLSEPGSVRIVLRRLGRKVGEIRRRGLQTGTNTIPFSGKLGRRKLRPGQYAAVLIARDQAGNRSLPALIEFRVLRPKLQRH
ncbi:MAG TPA: hypothetical protein VF072_12275 [Thermoleophilaceae bacterium]